MYLILASLLAIFLSEMIPLSQIHPSADAKNTITLKAHLQKKRKREETSCLDAPAPAEKKIEQEKKRKKHSFTPKEISLLTPFETDCTATLENIFANKKEGTIYVNSFFFTNPTLAHCLANLKKKNITIKIVVLIDKLSHFHSKKILPILFNAQIPVYLFPSTEEKLNHCKYITWKYKSSEGRTIYRAFSGSANLTLLGTESNGNFEHMTIHPIDKKTFKSYVAITKHAAKASVLLNKGPVDNHFLLTPFSPIKPNPKIETPKKGTSTYFSPIDNIENLIIKRINKTSALGKISIVTYALDLPLIIDALKNALNRNISIEIIMDIYGLRRPKNKEKTHQALTSLQKLGATIFIYQDKGIKKNHGKLIFIEDQNRIVCCQGSYNLTPTSKESFNQFEILAAAPSKTSLEKFKNHLRPLLLEKCTLFNPESKYNSSSQRALFN